MSSLKTAGAVLLLYAFLSPTVGAAQLHLPLAPVGSYLQQCSYSTLAYDHKKMSIKCGSHGLRASILLSVLRGCLENGFGIEWGGTKKLACDNRQYKTGGRMIGDAPVPMGPYIMS